MMLKPGYPAFKMPARKMQPEEKVSPYLQISPYEIDGGQLIGRDPREVPLPISSPSATRRHSQPQSGPTVLSAAAGKKVKCGNAS